MNAFNNTLLTYIIRSSLVFAVLFCSNISLSAQQAPLASKIPYTLMNWTYLARNSAQPGPEQLGQIEGKRWLKFSRSDSLPLLKTGPGGRAWLRVRLPEYKVAAPVLHISLLFQTFEVYTLSESGSRLIYTFGELKSAGEPVFAGWPLHIIKLPASASGNYVYFRIYSDENRIGMTGPVRLHSHGELILEIIRSQLDRFILGVLAFFCGLFGFFVYLRRREEKIYLYFALFAISAGVFLVANRTLQIQQLFWYAPRFWYYLGFMSLYLIPVWLGAFICQVKPNRFLNVLWKTHLVYGILGLAGHVSGLLPFYKSLYPNFYLSLLSGVFVLGLIALSAIRGNRESRILILGIFVLVGLAIYDLLGVLQILPWPRPMLAYGMSFFLIFLGLILILRFREVQDRMTAYSQELEAAQVVLKDYAENLEAKVVDRTREVSESLEKIKRLKDIQDGDYYLTSLLMKPFIRLDKPGQKYEVDMLLRQKKSFIFKKRQVELGGDICNIQPLTLGGKSYLAFLNGDAMGKSMQGAGGAIVLGVIYESLIHRSVNVAGNRFAAPAEWLEHCLAELHYAFLRFDGSMMASIILGLLEEETGWIHYINAEHPAPVLYKNNQANFLENDSQLPKLGFDEGRRKLVVNQLLLEPGDVFLMGSDGRDDVKIGENAGGSRIINDDESAFLRLVEISGGRLETIEKELKNSGELIDDLSLISIRYPG